MTQSPSTSTSPDASGHARETIVVGLDQSHSGRAALDWAARYARLTKNPLRAISIVDWPTGLTGPADGGMPLEALLLFPNEEQGQEMRRATQTSFDQVNPDPGWELLFRVGHVGRILAQESRGAQLLVIGTGEHVGLGRILLGSTSHYCLSHASCPVVAVPSEVTEST